MLKENIVKCKNCGRSFNNYYKNKSRWAKVSCSRECARKLRSDFNVLGRKKRRHELKKQHKCIICAVEIEPIIVYHQFCPKHKQRTSNNQEITTQTSNNPQGETIKQVV